MANHAVGTSLRSVTCSRPRSSPPPPIWFLQKWANAETGARLKWLSSSMSRVTSAVRHSRKELLSNHSYINLPANYRGLWFAIRPSYCFCFRQVTSLLRSPHHRLDIKYCWCPKKTNGYQCGEHALANFVQLIVAPEAFQTKDWEWNENELRKLLKTYDISIETSFFIWLSLIFLKYICDLRTFYW